MGFLKALFDTFFVQNKKFRPRNPADDMPVWNIDEIDVPYPDDDPGERWWQAQLEKRIEAKEKADELIAKMLIEDYESEHAEENEQKSENPYGNGMPVEEHGMPIDGGIFEMEADADETEDFDNDYSDDDSEADDFDMDSDFDDDSRTYDGYIG